ncbi:hypothetical protein KFE80_08420 [bacterium SCSIO 12696]|nr:hypothetical protein KFE80_08420 [bacterium SCSIO 12696]
MSRSWWLAGCLLLVTIAVILAYPLAESAEGEGFFHPSQIGFWVCLQYSAMAIGMLGVWYAARRSTASQWAAQLKWLLALGVLLRVLLIPVDSYTSNDIKRYLWDGKVALSGYDPYTTPPSSLPLQPLHSDWSPPPEHNAYASLYPPLAMASFTAAATAGPQWAPWIWKILVSLANIGLLFVGFGILRQINQQRHLPLLALSPILIFEGGIAAHLDIFSALAVAIAVLCWLRGRLLVAGAAIAAGVLLKLLPVVLLPVMWVLLRQWRLRWQLLTGFLLALLVGYGGAFAVGWEPIGILFEFFAKWRFGSPLFALLDNTLPTLARQLAVMILAVAGIWCAARIGRQDPLAGFAVALATPLLLSPVVFPWYLSVLVLFSAIRPNLFLLLWLLLLPLSYEVLGSWLGAGVWQPANWVLVVVACGWLVAAGQILLKRRLFINSFHQSL